MEKLFRRAACGVLCLLAWPAVAGTVSMADLARHQQYLDVKISGDGKHLAATTVVKGKPMLALIDLTTHKGGMVTPREGNQVVNFWWINNNRVLYTEGTKVAGWDRPFSTGEIMAMNADGSNPQILFGYRAGGPVKATHIQQPKSEYAYGELIDRLRTGDGNHVLIGVTPWETGVEGAFTQIFKMDVNSGSKHQVATAPVRDASFVVDNHGVVRFAYGRDVHSNLQVYYREGEDKPWALLYQATTDHNVPWPATFSRDDSHVYMWCRSKGAVEALCSWDVASKTMEEPLWTSDTVEADGLIRSLDGFDVVGVYSTPGTPAASAFVAGTDTIKAISALSKKLPGESVRIVSSTDDGSKAVALASSDMDPGTYYLWDKATGDITPLFQRAEWINPNLMAAKQPIEFKARDGLTIHGYLSTPPGKEQAKHMPLVVYIHGGPYGIRDDWEFDEYVQMMATRGYAVLQVNYRGSGGYGEGFTHAGYREWGGKMQDDVTDGTNWAIQQGITTAGHICIFGGSYGGYAALEGAVKEPDLYRCAIGYVGVYDLPLSQQRSNATESLRDGNFWRSRMGDNAEQLAAHSPINQLDHLKASVMLVVGGQDTTVLPNQGENLHTALQKRGIAHEWLYKSDEGHGFYDEKHATELFDRITQFLDRNIGQGAGSAVGSP
ncbi:alpha/beta hydrolase family protein [Dyella soli]|uniref:S9 family peptidase n=1 Tax=Dyella soli TaxID=522319 RepID=A0A4R0YV43_9GAMM|nr:prolyl oligopeptidase family serine peptidase [Dyella soli]TCI10833.1 S9 family peptidase [Dyella soli]